MSFPLTIIFTYRILGIGGALRVSFDVLSMAAFNMVRGLNMLASGELRGRGLMSFSCDMRTFALIEKPLSVLLQHFVVSMYRKT
jgi:hypothetical protein